MHDLISGKNGSVHLSLTPLVCIRSREEYDDLQSLGYPFLLCDQIFPFLELRSAAVDCSKKRKPSNGSDLRKMETRVEAQFTTLIANGIRHVVLSAFGCGAFKNDPSDIAWVYKQAVERHRASILTTTPTTTPNRTRSRQLSASPGRARGWQKRPMPVL